MLLPYEKDPTTNDHVFFFFFVQSSYRRCYARLWKLNSGCTQKFPMNRSDMAYGGQANGLKSGAPNQQQQQQANGQQPNGPGQQQGQQQQQQQYTIVGEQPNDKQHLMSNGLQTINSFQFNGHSGGAKQCEIHHSVLHRRSGTASSGGRKKNVNFCRAWLNKFPSRSKRIDVISRIFFPKMFALFNLVYWTTYLFREDDIVQA